MIDTCESYDRNRWSFTEAKTKRTIISRRAIVVCLIDDETITQVLLVCFCFSGEKWTMLFYR